MKRHLFFLLVFPVLAAGQANPGPRIKALGGMGAALQDCWSIQSNPAGIAGISHITIATAYEREYLNPDLSRQSALLLLPLRTNVFGLSFQTYGFSAYREQRASLAYAKNFGDKVFAALAFNYHQILIKQYGNTETYSFDLGLQYRMSDNWLLGVHVANPNAIAFESVNNLVPVFIEVGASYAVSDKVLLNSAIKKVLDSATDGCFGVEYKLADGLAARGGLSVNPFSQYAGFGYNFKRLRIDAAFSSHRILGYSPQVALAYEF